MKTNYGLVSVIIPTHNRYNMLIKAVDSVINQSYNNLEIIIIADSCDYKESYISKLLSIDNRITYYSFNNLGGGKARNIGMDKSSGVYIAFLDDDDFWEKTKIEEQIKVFNDHRTCSIVFCDHRIINEKTNKVLNYKRKKVVDLEDILSNNYIGSYSFAMINSTSIRIDENLKSLQDWDLWVKILSTTCGLAINTNTVLANYRIHTNEKISTNHHNLYIGHKLWLQNHKNLMGNFCIHCHQLRIRRKKRNNERRLSDIISVFLLFFRFPYKFIETILLLKILFNKELR